MPKENFRQSADNFWLPSCRRHDFALLPSLLILLFSLFVAKAIGATVSPADVLSALQSQIRLLPGRGIGRSLQQCLQEGSGNALEITCVAQAMLQEQGLLVEMVHGIVCFSKEQQLTWQMLPKNERGLMAAKCCWTETVDADLLAKETVLPWLRVLMPWLPKLGMAAAKEDSMTARQWVQIFPAMQTTNNGIDDFEMMDTATVRSCLATMATSIQWEEKQPAHQSGGCCINFPWQYLQQKLNHAYGSLVIDQSDAGGGESAAARMPFPGYHLRAPISLQPVTIVEVATTNAEFMLAHKAEIIVTLADQEGIVLQATFPQEAFFQSALLLFWEEKLSIEARSDVEPYLMQIGDQTIRRPVTPILRLGQLPVVKAENERDLGAELILSLSRRLQGGSQETDCLTARLQVGAASAVAVSSGSMTQTAVCQAAAEIGDPEISNLSILAGNLRCRLDQEWRWLSDCAQVPLCANLQAVVCSREAVFHRLYGQPLTVKALNLVATTLSNSSTSTVWQQTNDKSTDFLSHLTFLAHLLQLMEAELHLRELASGKVLSPLVNVANALSQARHVWLGQVASTLPRWLLDVGVSSDLPLYCLRGSLEFSDFGQQSQVVCFPGNVWHSWVCPDEDCDIAYFDGAAVPWPTAAQWQSWRANTSVQRATQKMNAARQLINATLTLWNALENEAEAFLDQAELDLLTLTVVADLRQRLATMPEIAILASDDSYYGQERQSCTIEILLEQTEWWELLVRDQQNNKVFRQVGAGSEAMVNWNFTDELDREVPDGYYRLQTKAIAENLTAMAEIVICRDQTAPEIQVEVHAQRQKENIALQVELAINDLTEVEANLLLLDEEGQLLAEKSGWLFASQAGFAQHHQFMLPPEANGICCLAVRAVDKAGNETCQQIEVMLPDDASAPEIMPQELKICILGLSDEHHVIAENAILQVEMNGQYSCRGLKVFLDGMVLEETAGRQLPWRCQLPVINMTEGRHLLQAVVCNDDNQEVVSAEYVFFYSPLAGDFVAPIIFLAATGDWLLTADLPLLISAWDNKAMQTLSVADNFGTVLTNINAVASSQNLSLPQFQCSPELLSRGFLVTARDQQGNVTVREVKYPLPASGKPPTVELTCEWLAEGVVREMVTLQAVVNADLPLAKIKTCLNGIERQQEVFPENGCFIFTVSEDELRAGSNEFTVQAWDCAGRESALVKHVLRTDVFRNVLCQPNPVRPWAGTSDEICASAELKEELSWQVELLNHDLQVLQSVTGEGRNILVKFPVADLADGFYQVRFRAPAQGVELLREIEVDIIQGVPLAEVTYPVVGAVLEEGVVRVLGKACTSENDPEVSYALELWNDFGQQVSMQAGSLHGDILMTAMPLIQLGEATASKRDWRRRAVVDDCLAVLDLSTVPNGCWRLRLLVEHAGQLVVAETKFTLQSQLKVAQVAFSEEDLRVPLAGQELLLQRYYNSQNAHDDGLGVGWTMTLTAMQPVIDDLRAPIEDIFGQSHTIRYGGSRDVTVTLVDGRRVTFAFSLREGGGWSFCHHATWEAPPGVKATLTPLSDDRLMTLPGLRPYWAAAGPMTPWQNYDFPKYVLTDQEGVQYYLTRDKLGEAELLGKGQDEFGIQTGEPATIDVYGDLQLSQIVFPNGQQLQISNTGVRSCLADGIWEDVLRLENEPQTGRRLAVTRLGGEYMQVAYVYDDKGNLQQVLQRENSEQLRLKRQYAYEMPAFPHLLTSVQDGEGRTLLEFAYDDQGKLRKTAGADGAGPELYAQPTAGYAVVVDATGRETVFLHDNQGRVNAKIGPGGERTTYEYDQQGRETAMINPLGQVTRKTYDEQGNLTARIDANGEITAYERLPDGKCLAIVDPAGRRLEYEYDLLGTVKTVRTVTGLKLEKVHNELGRPIMMAGTDGEAIQLEYGNNGLLTAATSTDGTRLEWDYDEKKLPAAMTLSYFHPQNETLWEMAMFWDHDEEGKVVRSADSMGHWRAYTYDAAGKVNLISTDHGSWQRRLHDAAGRLAEKWSQKGEVQRFIYDAAGRMLAHAYGAILDLEGAGKPPPAVMVFPLLCQYIYDQSGNQTAEVISTQACVEREGLPNGLYRCHLLSAGVEAQRQQFYHDAAGRLIQEESACGCRRFYQLDPEGRTIAMSRSDGATWKYTYGKLGEMLSVADPLGSLTSFIYDQRGLLSARCNCDQSRREYVYDQQGRLIAEMDEKGNCREVERDAFGLPRRQLMPPLQHSTAMPGQLNQLQAAYTYDYHDGKAMVCITDPLGRQTAFQRDEIGRLTGELLPEGQINHTIYSDYGLMPAKYRNFNGQWIAFEYEQEQLLTRKICAQDEALDKIQREYVLAYDSGQKLRQIIRREFDSISGIAQEEVAMTWEYDLFGRVAQRLTGNGDWVSWQYDGDNRRQQLKTENSRCDFIYDHTDQDWQVTVSKAPGKIGESDENYLWQYDQRDLPVAVHLPDKGEVTVQWNDRGFPTRLKCLDPQGEIIYAVQAETDVTGKMIARQRQRRQTDGSLAVRNQRFAYDSWGRLEMEESFAAETPCLCYVQEITYDLAGNRLAVDRSYDNGNFLRRQFQYDNNDRLLRESRETAANIAERHLLWDDNGSLLSVTSLGQEMRQWQFAWDCENRLTKVTIVDYGDQGQVEQERQLMMCYDAQGLLCRQEMRKISAAGDDSCWAVEMLWDEAVAGREPRLLETVAFHDGVEYERCFWLWAHVLLAAYSSRTGWRRCLSDPHGHVEGWWEPEAKQLSEWRDYDAWGELLLGDMTPGLSFAGEWQEPETGLIYLRSRFYWPEMGIFLSRDPCPGNPESPLSLHRYSYCQNDPVNSQDPSGCFSVSAIMSAMSPKNYCLPLKIWRGGVDFLAQRLCSSAMTIDFTAQPVEHDQATVVVHGMQYHAPGYADDFVDLLSSSGVEHDWYQFIWSGCQLASVLLPPNIYFHSFALASLSHSLALLPGKGYSRLNVVAHSWGTVLTRDALRHNPLSVRHWVTMGSPLSSGTPLPSTTLSWMNVVTHSDPVVHLAPLVQMLGFVDGLLPLYLQKSPPITVDLGPQSAEPHSSYWHHPLGIARIAAFLRQ